MEEFGINVYTHEDRVRSKNLKIVYLTWALPLSFLVLSIVFFTNPALEIARTPSQQAFITYLPIVSIIWLGLDIYYFFFFRRKRRHRHRRHR